MFKWIKRIFIAAVLLIVVGILVAYFLLNSLLRSAIQQQATASLGVPTTLGSANLSIFGGKLSLANLDVSSPPKFSSPNLFTLDGISVAVHYGQLTNSPIHIEQIVINHPDLVVEQANIQLNLDALLKQMPQTPKTTSGSETAPVKLVIDELDLNNAMVTFLPGIPGLANSIQVPIASMTLKDIGNAGGNQNGVAIKDVVLQTATALAGKAVQESKLSPPVKLAIAQELTAVSSQGGFDAQLQDLTGTLTKQLQPTLDNTLNQLLGGKKK